MLLMANKKENILAAAGERAFGERVLELRNAAGFTQEQLAALLSRTGRSYTQSTIAKIEKGTRPTSVGELYLLASALDTTVSKLLEPAGWHQIDLALKATEREIEWLNQQVAVKESEIARARASLEKSMARRGELLSELEAMRRGDGDGEHPEAS